MNFLNDCIIWFLGKVFLDFKSELEEVYKVYCQNHDDAIALLECYEKDENIQKQVLECLENLRLVRVKTCSLLTAWCLEKKWSVFGA